MVALPLKFIILILLKMRQRKHSCAPLLSNQLVCPWTEKIFISLLTAFMMEENLYSVNHFVLIVGYGSVDGVDYWIAKISGGKDWGIDGYIWNQRNTGNLLGVCRINFFASYPTKEKSAILVSPRVKADKKLDYSPL
ncbi:hypothetical protein CR513_17315, partial [Mucuna pruriens]